MGSARCCSMRVRPRLGVNVTLEEECFEDEQAVWRGWRCTTAVQGFGDENVHIMFEEAGVTDNHEKRC